MTQGPTPMANGVAVPFAFMRALKFATLPTGHSGTPGWVGLISDSPTAVPGATVTVGGGSIVALVWWNGTSWICLGAGGSNAPSSLTLTPVAFTGLPATPTQGTLAFVTDSTTNTWGATVTVGGGTDPVLVGYNGTNWTVVGK